MRRLAVALVLASLPLAAAACGSSSKSKAPSASGGPAALAVVESAAKKTASAGSEHLTLNAGGSASGQQIVVTGAGDFDNKGRVGSLHVDFSAAGISASIDAVLSSTDMYLKSSLFAALLPAGKSWLKLDLAKAGAAQGLNLNTLLSQDPTQLLAALQSLKGATKVGSEQVDGVSTTHYRASIDLSKLPAGSSGAPSVYDAWVGGDGYVHRVRVRIATGSGTKKSAITLTADLSGFGESVKVAVPPAAQTLTSTGSLPGLGG
ncbi:MAG TPA: LppX_LprAFG lipoprotein [Gaiellaceae bacterium]|nr:LppX_LprAFG lipoprotein [Gaiellaceae bacterium]